MPLALASDAERLASKRFDALDAGRARAALPADVAARARHAAAAHAPPRARAPRPPDRPAAEPAREPAHRRRAAAPRAPAAAQRAAAARDAVRHLGLDGALRARLPAVPRLRRRQRAERRGVRVRDAADAPDARARRPPPRARDPARGGDGAGLVERDAHRRCAEDVQRPPRAPRHGARRGRRDPLRRLGARRPALVGREMQRLARLAHRIVWVNPRVSASAFSVQAGGMVAALPHCDALVSGHSFRRARRGRRRDRRHRASRRLRGAAAADADEPEPWASATPVPGSSVAMPSGHGPSRGKTTPGWVTDDDVRRPASTPAASGRAVPPHPLGGPQPAFCDLEEHNALTAHQERQRLAQHPWTRRRQRG